ncbi:MAG TPA: C4-dicarboxylate transporter DctA [Steroidobacteraceae bacterium]|nr:C4-dicarboxylate transporter DctA [Steroidobacteraceae bacterium]
MRRRYWYSSLFAQVLIGIVAGTVVGIVAPRFGTALKPLGDGFLRLIKMVIGLVVFCTVVSGMGAARDMKKVGRLGGKALIYFEVVSTLALLFGATVANVVHPGYALDARGAALDSSALSGFMSQRRPESVGEFLLAIVPNTLFEAFSRGDILPIVFISVLFGYVLSHIGGRAVSVRLLIEELGEVVFGIINFLMRFAPIGAFGAMAYTLGKFGLSALGPLIGLIATFYLTCAAFVLVVLAAICRWCRFSILRLLRYLKEELLVTLGSGSSDVALPALMAKLETLGCSRSVVGLVVPTGFVFNTDGTSIYITLAALFVAQALRIDLSVTQQLALFGVALLTSKGASGIAGAGFIALIATLTVVPTVPISGVALLLGIDRFMGTGRALVNLIGNAVATVVMAASEGELDRTRMRAVLSADPDPRAAGLPVKVS